MHNRVKKEMKTPISVLIFFGIIIRGKKFDENPKIEIQNATNVEFNAAKWTLFLIFYNYLMILTVYELKNSKYCYRNTECYDI